MDELHHREGNEHAEFVLEGLNRCRQLEPKLCDFSLTVGDHHFPCHRSVLCLFSSFFKGAIQGGFREDLQHSVHLGDVPCNDMKVFLDYFYTGVLILHHSNVEGLLHSATKLGISKIISLCLDYIRHQIDQTNCLEILKFAREYNYEVLEASAQQYLIDHLHSVFECEMPEGEIQVDDVMELLRDTQTHKQGEESISLTVLTWLQRDVEGRRKYAHHLLDYVSWRKLSSPFLLKVLLRHPLLNVDQTIKSLVLDRVRRSYDDEAEDNIVSSILNSGNDQTGNSSEISTTSTRAQSSITSFFPSYPNHRPPQFPHQALLLVGGLTLGEAERGDTSQPNVMSYHPVDRLWRERAAWPERGLRGFSVAKLDNNVVVSGGCSTTVSKHMVIKRAWLYLVASDQWQQLPDMMKARAFHSTCQLHSQLYSVGGATGNDLDVEVFDQHRLTWTSLKKSAPRMVYNFTAATCNSKLIIFGSGLTSTIFLQCYNPAVDIWTVIRSPNVPRHLSAPVCVTSNDETKIFVSGDNTKKLFVFDPNKNGWRRASDMNNLHSNGNLVIVGNDIFHTGGHWEEDGYWDEMESFDVEKDIWTSQGALPHLWLYHGCASVFLEIR